MLCILTRPACPPAAAAPRYRCDVCRTLTEASRAVTLAALPPVLTIHLNRTLADGHGKVRAPVQVPWTLRLGAWAAADCPRRHARYALVAIVFHSGHAATSGHYLCAARGADPAARPQRWFLFDDGSVSATTARQLQRLLAPGSAAPATAFLLFYQREDEATAAAGP